MKHAIALVAALVLIAFASPGKAAQPSSPSVQSAFPPGYVPTEVRRWMRDDPKTWDIVTSVPNMYPPPWRDTGSLGWLSSQPFANSHALHVCQRRSPPHDLVTSAFANCEGHTRISSPYVLGFVSSAPIPGTVPLYRCLAGKNEFDSTHPQCEGHRMSGTLGYIFP
jgi:hypothetical protein